MICMRGLRSFAISPDLTIGCRLKGPIAAEKKSQNGFDRKNDVETIQIILSTYKNCTDRLDSASTDLVINYFRELQSIR